MTREDIISLGWNPDKDKDTEDSIICYKDNFALYYEYSTSKLSINKFATMDESDFNRFFVSQMIRNLIVPTVLELETLMTQLQIEIEIDE